MKRRDLLRTGAVAGIAAVTAGAALAQEAGAVTLNYGLFINTIVSFIIVAFAIFLLIRSINRLHQEEQAPPAEPIIKECPFCFSEIPIQATRCPNCTSEL